MQLVQCILYKLSCLELEYENFKLTRPISCLVRKFYLSFVEKVKLFKLQYVCSMAVSLLIVIRNRKS